MNRGAARPVRRSTNTQIVTVPSGDRTLVRLPLPDGGEAVLALSLRGRTVALEVLGSETPRLLERLAPRERHVALLVAEGLGNREIAQRLGITPATVACHLVRTYRKLGLAGRYELTVAVLRASGGH